MVLCFRTARAVAAGIILALIALAPVAEANDQLLRGPVPAWVTRTNVAPAPPAAAGEGVQVLLYDAQYRIEDGAQAYYMRTRAAALSPQGLAVLGNVSLVWSPDSQDVTVHHVTILRDGEVIDVLATQSFETLRREANLEIAMLDGRLTAILQPSGLRVGDVLDFAWSITSRDPVVSDQPAHAMSLNMPVPVVRQHVRASWPSDMTVAVRASYDWVDLPVRRSGGYSSIELTRENVQPIIVPEDAPLRLHSVNLIELSSFRDWAQVATAIKPLYDRTRQLEPGSPLHAEIARIRALSADPAVQAAAALRLVQDQVRYVALMMGEGALTPATADETWTRRFGDCKAKTVLLLALLDGLGIAAQPAAVNLFGGDGLDERLPSIGAFNHVIVRAEIGGKVYWLDGTRRGDRALETIGTPALTWALPLVPGGGLERLVVEPLTTPTAETIIAFDASGGQHAPAAVTGSMIMRGEAAAVLAGQMSLISAAQRDQGIRGVWNSVLGEVTIDTAGSTYDEEANVLTLTLTGSKALDWRSDGMIPPGATYSPLYAEERPEGAFRTAPYLIEHPTYSRQYVTVRLPDDGVGYAVTGGVFDRTELGHQISRTTKLEGDLATIEVIQRSLVGEITADEAKLARAAAEARTADYPRITQPSNYRLTEADRTALNDKAPSTADEWLSRAHTLSLSSDFAGALAAADKAVELAPDNSAAWANRGVYRFWTRDLAGAAADLEKAVDLDPSERIAMNGNALLARAEGRHQDVVVEMTRALRQAPRDAFALTMRSQAYMSLEQYDRALRDLDARIANQPTDSSAQLGRAWVLDRLGQKAESAAALDAVVAANPEDEGVVIAASALRLEQGEAQSAFDIIDRLISATPDPESFLLMQRAEAAIALGRLDLAAADFQTVRDGSPDEPYVLNNLCWTAAVGGVMLDQALRDCEAALVLEPAAPAILDSKGRVLLQQGDIAGAIATYDAALAAEPEMSASLYGRGLARIAQGDPEAGEADKAAALAINPKAADDFKAYAQPASGGAS